MQQEAQVLLPLFLLSIGFINFPGGLEGQESTCNVGDPGLIPGSGRSPREGNGNPLQCSFLENPMDRGAWPLEYLASFTCCDPP